MKRKFLGVYNPSIILTYIGTFFSLSGIMQMFKNDITSSSDTIAFAMIFLVFAGICDLFDGTIARLCKRTEREKQFGIQLDSLADVISFVAFPAIIIIYVANDSWHAYLISFFYLFAGIMRLGWFNITTEENKGYYFGLPVTSSSLIFPFVYALISALNLHKFSGYIFEIIGFITGMLFILNFRFKKPKTIFATIWIVLSIIIIFAILLV